MPGRQAGGQHPGEEHEHQTGREAGGDLEAVSPGHQQSGDGHGPERQHETAGDDAERQQQQAVARLLPELRRDGARDGTPQPALSRQAAHRPGGKVDVHEEHGAAALHYRHAVDEVDGGHEDRQAKQEGWQQPDAEREPGDNDGERDDADMPRAT